IRGRHQPGPRTGRGRASVHRNRVGMHPVPGSAELPPGHRRDGVHPPRQPAGGPRGPLRSRGHHRHVRGQLGGSAGGSAVRAAAPHPRPPRRVHPARRPGAVQGAARLHRGGGSPLQSQRGRALRRFRGGAVPAVLGPAAAAREEGMPVIPMPDRGDWSPDQFEQAGQAVLRMLRDHFAAIDEVPVASSIGAAELKGLLDGPVPEEPEDFEAVLADTRTKVIPHLTHWNHPNFFAYFATSASGPGILADTVISALNVNAMLWKTSPAASALEQVVLRWLAEMAGYVPGEGGVLIHGQSLGTFYARAAAREATGLEIRERGMAGRHIPVLRVYCTEHAHGSIDKAVIAV